MVIYRKSTTVFVLAAVLLAFCGAAIAAEVVPSLRVHGYMQNRVYEAPGLPLQYRSERISVSSTATLTEDSNAYVEVYYHPWAPGTGLYLESAYYDTALGAGRVRVGKGRRLTFGIVPSYPNRRTSNYGIVAESFTQDRIQGVQYVLQRGMMDFGVSAHTGYRLGTRAAGEVPGAFARNVEHQVQHLAFRDAHAGGGSPARLSNKMEVAARIGGRWANGVRAGLSLSESSLDEDDLVSLTTSPSLLAPGGTPSLLPAGTTDRGRRVLGLDFAWRQPSGLVVQSEWYDAAVSDLDYGAWNVLLGWEPPAGWKFFGRYSRKDMDTAATANPLTWDLTQISLSAVQPLRRALWLQYEYEINSESPPAGTPKVKNNVFFVELFTGF